MVLTASKALRRRREVLMRALRYGLFASAILLLGPGFAAAKCGDNPGDPQALADARAQVETDCPCAESTSHGVYVSCAAGVANERVGLELLPNQCKGQVVRCAARSTCGKPGFVTCCRTKATGVTKCSTKSDATRCTAPAG